MGSIPARATKRLVFSSWKVVPKVVAAILSYEAERRMATIGGDERENTAGSASTLPAAAQDPAQPGQGLARDAGPRADVPEHVAGRTVDPLRWAGAEDAPTVDQAVATVEEELRPSIDELTAGAPVDGAVDERLVLGAADAAGSDGGPRRGWWSAPDLAARWVGADDEEHEEGTSFDEHLDYAREILADPSVLGRVPDDLSTAVRGWPSPVQEPWRCVRSGGSLRS
jgi:hypothetical protein